MSLMHGHFLGIGYSLVPANKICFKLDFFNLNGLISLFILIDLIVNKATKAVIKTIVRFMIPSMSFNLSYRLNRA